MATLNIQPSAKDTRLNEDAPTTNYGSSTIMVVENRNANRNERAILEFDISSLPVGTVIESATLSMKLSLSFRIVGQTIWAYKLIRTDWIELEATWDNYKTGNNWASLGGDYVTSNPAGGSDTSPAAGNWIDFDVRAIVQDAYDSSIDAEFLIRCEVESEDDSGRRMSLRTRNYPTPTDRPKLVIVYHIETAHDISSVKLYLQNFLSPLGSFEVSIRAVDGQGKPYGADLAYGSILCSSIGVTAWYQIIFGTPYAILGNTKYAIVVRATAATGSKYINWKAHYLDDDYADGAYIGSTNSGVTWGNPSSVIDCLFQEFDGAVKYESYEGVVQLNIPVIGVNWKAQSFGAGKLFIPNVQIF